MQNIIQRSFSRTNSKTGTSIRTNRTTNPFARNSTTASEMRSYYDCKDPLPIIVFKLRQVDSLSQYLHALTIQALLIFIIERIIYGENNKPLYLECLARLCKYRRWEGHRLVVISSIC